MEVESKYNTYPRRFSISSDPTKLNPKIYKNRYIEQKFISRGSFGTVIKVLDFDKNMTM
jgi:hypothetical protein